MSDREQKVGRIAFGPVATAEQIQAQTHERLRRLQQRESARKAANDAGKELESLRAEHAALRAERDEAREQFDKHVAWADDQAKAAESRLAALEAALTALEQLWRQKAAHLSIHGNPEKWFIADGIKQFADDLAALRARLTPEPTS